jgi:hypothetical protein
MTKTLTLLVLLIVAVVLLDSGVALAQSPPALPNGPDQVPVGGGLGLLAAAGLTYAVVRVRQLRAAR